MSFTSAVPYLICDCPDGRRDLRLESGSVWRLGRNPNCSIELKDETISRNHAMIQRADNGDFLFIDLGSQNGSFVNDRRVSTPVALRNNDRIRVGRTVITFCNPIQSASRAPSYSDLLSSPQTALFFNHQRVTVLVVDIRDYTGLTNTIPQSVLCQMIGKWFSEAERIMQKHGSGIQKYIGDAIMALWVHQKADREQRDILEVLQALTEFAETNAKLGERFQIPQSLRIGAGISTGIAAVGSPGTGDLTAMGDCVNAAFRLEAGTKELKTDLVMGADTFDCLRQLPGLAGCFEAHELSLKGYVAPVKTWSTSYSKLAEFLDEVTHSSTLG